MAPSLQTLLKYILTISDILFLNTRNFWNSIMMFYSIYKRYKFVYATIMTQIWLYCESLSAPRWMFFSCQKYVFSRVNTPINWKLYWPQCHFSRVPIGSPLTAHCSLWSRSSSRIHGCLARPSIEGLLIVCFQFCFSFAMLIRRSHFPCLCVLFQLYKRNINTFSPLSHNCLNIFQANKCQPLFYR